MESFTLKNGGKMNTYYLKKFRKEAYNMFGITKYNEHYLVIYRRSEVWSSKHFNIESAIKSLYKTRRRYILELLEDERQKRDMYKDKELNKQLAKL